MITKLIKELRARTNAGFLDCKKALEANDLDIEKSIAWLQENGRIKAAKKSGRIAADGVVNIIRNNHKIIMYEINSQTDFVAQNKIFEDLVMRIGNILLKNSFNNLEEALQIRENTQTINEIIVDATATIGEKIELRRIKKFDLKENEVAGCYVHVNKKIAAVLICEGGNELAIKNASMHIASMNPEFLDETHIDQEKILKIKKTIVSETNLEGKPEKIREKILDGMFYKKLSEISFIDQEFVMEKIKVKDYLSKNGAIAKEMARFEVGEGIEKKKDNFVDEVASQMK